GIRDRIVTGVRTCALPICNALLAERDLQFTYLGLQTLYDRYFIHSDGIRFELPQAFYMRVAMGLAINEIEREQRAIEFYNLLSKIGRASCRKGVQIEKVAG